MLQVQQAINEIEHFHKVSLENIEATFGWASPAGQLRVRRRGNLISRIANLTPSTRALEIGCGSGVFTERFSKTGVELVAVDISSDLLAAARSRKLSNVVFVEKRFEDLELNESSFDAIIGVSILHHLDLEAALPLIYKLLKPNGVMCFSEPNMLNPEVWLERKFRRFFWYVSPDEIAFVRFQLDHLLQHFGFTEIRIVPFDWLHPLMSKRIMHRMNEIGVFLEQLPIIREFAGSLLISGCRP